MSFPFGCLRTGLVLLGIIGWVWIHVRSEVSQVQVVVYLGGIHFFSKFLTPNQPSRSVGHSLYRPTNTFPHTTPFTTQSKTSYAIAVLKQKRLIWDEVEMNAQNLPANRSMKLIFNQNQRNATAETKNGDGPAYIAMHEVYSRAWSHRLLFCWFLLKT